jgi:hypothetical protein
MSEELPQSVKLELEIANPKFTWYIKNMNPEIAKWVQYSGIADTDYSAYIKFKASNCQMIFYIPLYFDKQNADLFRAHTDSVMQYFRDLKYSIV